MAVSIWGKPTYCIVTGASQGIGAQIAVEFSRRFGEGSLILLLARSEAGLKRTKQMINEANKQVYVEIHPTDLSKPNVDIFMTAIRKSLADHKIEPSAFSVSVIVHNAGSLGDINEFSAEMSDIDKMSQYFSLNLFSVMCLNSQFLKVFDDKFVGKRVVINITSLCAIKPIKSMGYYCVGKASREMFFRVLAEENSDLIVLSYSPGPVSTDMISDIMHNVRDEGVKDMFRTMKETKSILSVDQTVNRLVGILEKGKFQSGCRIDYFDPDE